MKSSILFIALLIMSLVVFSGAAAVVVIIIIMTRRNSRAQKGRRPSRGRFQKYMGRVLAAIRYTGLAIT